MNSEQKQLGVSGFKGFRVSIARRVWCSRTLLAAVGYTCFMSESQTQGFIEKDWLYFHYGHEPKSLSDVLSKLRSLPDRLSDFCRYKLTVSPVHVIIFPDREAYLRHLEKTLPKAPRRTSLFVVRGGKPTILAADGPSLQRDLLHEAVHAINFATFGSGQFP